LILPKAGSVNPIARYVSYTVTSGKGMNVCSVIITLVNAGMNVNIARRENERK
jgi:hypothetical protein